MKLEQEIEQSAFSIPQVKAHINTLFTAYWILGETKIITKKHGITPQQYNVLKILKGSHPTSCTANRIKKVMLQKSSDMTRLIDRLIIKKLVTRNLRQDNRRKIDINITEKGIDLLSIIDPLIQERFFTHTPISDIEADNLNMILDKMRI